jgi:hypothetical protein
MKVRNAILTVINCAVLLAANIAQPSRADEQVPFRAEYQTQFTVEVAFPIATVSATGEGKATHLGWIGVQSINESVNLLTGEGTAAYEFTAANGDTLKVTFIMIAVPTSTGLAVSGTWQMTEGTGRFAGATGSGEYSAGADFAGPDFGSVHVIMDGSISPPGALAN